jgi:hypothetical protein
VAVAKWVHELSGKRTLYCLADLGGAPDAILPFAQVVDLVTLPHPFLAGDKLTAGMIPVYDGKVSEGGVLQGSWKPQPFDDFGLLVLDSGTALAEMMFNDLAEKAAAGIEVGGEAAGKFADGGDGWGTVKVGGSTLTHYKQVQIRMHRLLERFAKMAQRERLLILLTFAEDRGESESTKVAQIGPKTVGSAQSARLPGLVKFCFRLVERTAAGITEGKHELWTAKHQDGGIQAHANRRYPVGGFDQAKHPICIEPADVVLALKRYIEVTAVKK